LRLLGLAAEHVRSNRGSSALRVVLCDQRRNGVQRPVRDRVVRLPDAQFV
jgi:hypothetical protein